MQYKRFFIIAESMHDHAAVFGHCLARRWLFPEGRRLNKAGS
jgi:HD-like signal output (HDOD) protein